MTDVTAHARVLVHRPCLGVWGVLADYRRDPEWRTGVLAMVPSTDGTVEVGTTTAETIRFGGRTQHVDGVVTEVEDGVRFAWRTTSGTAAHGERRVTDCGDGRTQVDLVLTVRGVRRVLRPLLAPLVRRTLAADARRLRRLGETDGRVTAAGPATRPRAS
jgi:hypothetical protein